MSRLLHFAAAGILAAFAAVSLVGLATAAPEQASTESACPGVICLMTLF